MNLILLFADSFETFKVFDKIDIQQASLTNNDTPKSVWQILNHLIIWQDYQINKLYDNKIKDINEIDTWFTEKSVLDQGSLNDSVAKFEKQIEKIKSKLINMKADEKDIEQKVKIVQDLSVHLSFHLGEIVLIKRQNGQYPMPNEMKDFLS